MTQTRRFLADSILRYIHDTLYYEEDSNGNWHYKAEKAWDCDMLPAIADALSTYIPRPAEEPGTPPAELEGIPEVVVGVRGGVAGPMIKPAGVRLILCDYDCENEDSNLSPGPDGTPCFLLTYEASEEFTIDNHGDVLHTDPGDPRTWICPCRLLTGEVSCDHLADIGTPLGSADSIGISGLEREDDTETT